MRGPLAAGPQAGNSNYCHSSYVNRPCSNCFEQTGCFYGLHLEPKKDELPLILPILNHLKGKIARAENLTD